jgi:hypothetical protein
MPYGDANAIAVEMAGEVLPVVRPELAALGSVRSPSGVIARCADSAIGVHRATPMPSHSVIDEGRRQDSRSRRSVWLPGLSCCSAHGARTG